MTVQSQSKQGEDVTRERVTGFDLPNSTLDAMAEKIGRFGWPYRKEARAIAIQMLAAALKEGGVVLADRPTKQGEGRA